MGSPVVLDTGPLVAFINRRDARHRWAAEQLRSLEPPFLTCEAVISESLFLLRAAHHGVPTLLNLLREDLVRLAFDLDDHLEAVARLLTKYHGVPMSLADACLVRMSELHDQARVFTLDSHFQLYRRHSRQAIPLIFPGP
ncbi:MAG: type II toxin-antitoxin system VapC family toxin [Verrucomicrobia bacterium]|nr:type II toxin-antitoxin system VapC family toxin [Verrucomicrobiota bacterium]